MERNSEHLALKNRQLAPKPDASAKWQMSFMKLRKENEKWHNVSAITDWLDTNRLDYFTLLLKLKLSACISL